MEITDLPPELLVKVFTFLPGRSLTAVCKTCKTFREAANVDSIWQDKCATEYKFTKFEGWNGTFRDIYTKVLHKYGTLTGAWQRHFRPYGGLAQIKFDEGRILCCEYFAPVYPHIQKPLQKQELFSISLNLQRNVELLCHKGYRGPHACNINWDEKTQKLKLECEKIHYHRHPEGKDKERKEWMLHKESEISEITHMKFEQCYEKTGSYELEHMTLPSPIRNAPIQPGLFKGHYGVHGIEIMELSYDSEMKNIHVLKITGDVNVPALNISLYVDLHRPMVLNLEQQETMHVLREIDTPDIPEGVGMRFEPRNQPFMLPQDCYNRQMDVPHQCKYRFHAKGRIAGHGYYNPGMTPGHFMVFDDHTFGFVWMELRSFSMYSRVMEKLD